MSSTSDIWLAFARTFSILFVVLALLILVFYMIRRLTNARGAKGARTYISVLGIHHFSPKEKLALVNIMGKTVLIGITPNQISKLTTIDADIDLPLEENKEKLKFSSFLSKKLSQPQGLSGSDFPGKG